jgi:hypothetical protein
VGHLVRTHTQKTAHRVQDKERVSEEQGPTALVEVERVFDLPSNEARVELERLEKLGKAKRSTLAGAAFWSA